MTLREALDALHRAGRIRSPVLPGMLIHRVECGQIYARRISVEVALVGEVRIDDPATCGCLSALAREASGEVLMAQHRGTAGRSAPPWAIVGQQSTRVTPWVGASGPTEGEAWSAALIAMAEALP